MKNPCVRREHVLSSQTWLQELWELRELEEEVVEVECASLQVQMELAVGV